MPSIFTKGKDKEKSVLIVDAETGKDYGATQDEEDILYDKTKSIYMHVRV